MVTVLPYVPETITVHLGAPDAYAANVTVSFPDYVKNVASSEIYPMGGKRSHREHSGDHLLRAQPRVHGILPQPRLRL